ncbi:MAG TPA: DNA replication terminus site-binding family protein [Gammaproteobacteria bacterium]|nr:DNA replication terminus site-binding family protein [Gammaproteobacteria bacterium]
MLSQFPLQQKVIETYNDLASKLDELDIAMQHDHELMCWTHGANLSVVKNAQESHRQYAYRILKQVEYLDTQKPREILVCAGFVGASMTTLKIVGELNLAKVQFKRAMLALRKEKISIRDPYLVENFESMLKMRDYNTANTLQKLGLARLHLKQCYRSIPVLPSAPHKISWTWAHTRSIKKISLQQAEKLLRKKSRDPGIENQLQLLSYLKNHEELAIVQELAPHLRVNIVLNHHTQERIMVKGPIPLFFPADNGTEWPYFKPPKEKSVKNTNRMVRNDVRLEPHAYLPAIRAHRYQQ